ncbi:hypothetical protein BGZ93_009905 [Podila epicladia]|nr:hypothetical protein BGZ92_006780 [Podila epicladia]KAG0089381.1 hypothetical protein BGZ93_009905 [Podila epicladia]
MTLDYAQRLGSYLPSHVEVGEMLLPKRLLESDEGGFPVFDSHGACVDSIGPVYDKNERDILALLRIRVVFGLDNSEKRQLGSFVCKRLASFFLHCYPDSITSIDLHACEVNICAHLASKLSHLGAIKLSRDKGRGISEQQLESLLSFIRTNRAAFPRKKPIHLDFDETWDYKSNRIDMYHSQQTQQQQLRFFEREYQAPRIALYEAVGNPISIDAGPCPGFYTIGKDISVDTLASLCDLDKQRHFYGETFDQQAFLRRCHCLESLEISVHCPDMFAWAVERLADGTVGYSEHLLRSLHDVQLRANLSVLNDVMAAFGDTLRHVKVQEASLPPSKQLDDVVCDVRFSRHSRVGDWILPFIRTINIVCHPYSGVYLGDFSSCPKLEKLKIKLIGDPNEDQAYIAPVWRLPHLKTLELIQTAALLFNYDSLDHMPSLESLVLIARSIGGKHPVMIPRLCSYYPPKKSSDGIALISTLTSQRWKDQWDLPRLKVIVLHGSPSTVFCFNWLKGCPSLKNLELYTPETFQRAVLSSSSEIAIMPPNLSAIDLQYGSGSIKDVDDSGFDHGMASLLESRLETITLEGPWVMSEADLARMLSFYAPNLERLRLPSDSCPVESDNWTWLGDQFVQATVNSRSLKHLESRVKVSEEIKSELGLDRIAPWEVKKCEEANKKILLVQEQNYVSKHEGGILCK